MLRRDFVRSSGIILGALPFAGLGKWDVFPPASTSEVVKLRIGKFKCTVFLDKQHKYLAKNFFINAPAEELEPGLKKYRATADNIPSPFIAMLLEKGDKKILIDTGEGFSTEPVKTGTGTIQLKGQLHRLFEKEGIKVAEITDVIISHFHPDHIGGIFSEEGKLLFPNAKFHMHQDEWDYWHSSRSVNQSATFKWFIEKNISELKDKNLNLVKGDLVDLIPGITAVKTEGHTPGQIALAIHSKKEQMLYIADAFLHPLHIERLDWRTSYDMDHEKARQDRIKLLDMAYRENMLVNAFHFDFPGFGRVEKNGNNWGWKYTQV